jgi:hypothetical protein
MHYSLLILIPFFLLDGTFPDFHKTHLKSGKGLPAAFQKSSVQIKEKNQPRGKEVLLHPAVFKRVWKSKKF